jgi:hypothetical protein
VSTIKKADETMIPLIFGAAIGLGKAIAGGVKAANKRRKMNAYLNQQEADNKAWYNANALSDYTQRADTQNLMKQLRDTLGRQSKKAAGSAVVTGATTEQQAVQKEQANKVISDTFSNIGAMGQRWKDNITDRYLTRKQSIDNQRMGMTAQQAASGENLMQEGFNTLGGVFGSYANGMMSGSSGSAGTLPSQTQWLPLG